MTNNYVPTLLPDSTKKAVELKSLKFSRDSLGKRIINRYEIFGVREGGFGIVFFTRDVESGQEYAIKTYKPEFAQDLLSIEEFKTETEFWIKLDPHPNIIRAHFLEIFEDLPYLFLEYVNGDAPSLRDRLKRIGKFDLQNVVSLAYQVCLAMEHANQKGEIAHLDLKPENLLITQHNLLKVTDFGLARRIRVTHGRYPRQESGSWPYVPPERFQGKSEDSRSDIYALGVILYEMLKGELPYPFKLSKKPKEAYRQLESFHAKGGMQGIVEKLYDKGDQEQETSRISKILGTCLESDLRDRFPNFTRLRKLLEYTFNMGNSDAAPIEFDKRKRALSLFKIGRTGEALAIYNQLLIEDPTAADVWLDVGRIYLEIGDKKEAFRFLHEALTLNSTLVEAKQLLSNI